MTDLLLRDARLWGREGRTDLRIRDGAIAAIGDALSGEGAAVEDLGGAVVIPGLVDAHAHVDKTLWGGPWVPRTAEPGLAAAIAYGRDRRTEFGVPNPDYITALLTNMVVSGTTHARSHVDIDPGIGIGAVHAVREGVERLAGRIDVELVAFPQTGILASPGTAELMEEALEAGVKTIGGIDPEGFDGDAERHLDLVFALAEQHGAEIDIHLHDGGDLGVREFDLIIERTSALGYTGKVVISHAFALCDADVATRARLIADLAELQIGLTSVAPKKILPLRELDDAGVERRARQRRRARPLEPLRHRRHAPAHPVVRPQRRIQQRRRHRTGPRGRDLRRRTAAQDPRLRPRRRRHRRPRGPRRAQPLRSGPGAPPEEARRQRRAHRGPRRRPCRNRAI